MDKQDLIVIGVDTGNRCIKTVTQTMLAGLYQSDAKMPYDSDSYIEYKGTYYYLGNDRCAYRRNKTVDDDYFVLTLFAILAELKVRGVPFGGDVQPPKIYLVVGLPPAHIQKLGIEFRDYFNRGVVDFVYGGSPVKIEIADVDVRIQGFSAICSDFKMVRSLEVAYVVDIGGYTTDVIGMDQGRVNHDLCISEDAGMIHLYNQIKDQLNVRFDSIPKESQIERLLCDRDYELEPGMKKIALSITQKYIDNLLMKLNEKSINLRLGTGIFVGGGSVRLERQIRKSPFVRDPIFIRNINANACGYEFAGKRALGV